MPALLSDRDLLARLIGVDSTSHRSNRPIADILLEYLDRPGVTLTRVTSEDDEKVNIIAVIGPDAAAGEGLILSGHLDTVPANEPEWESDPFTMVERDGAYFGRGTCDMKGFIALAVNAALSVEAAALQSPLVLLFTADEELGSLGARRIVAVQSSLPALPKRALIGEPTSLGVVRMHKGHLTMRITTRGRAAHSGSPQVGVNAIEPASELLCGLAELRKHFESQHDLPTSRFFPTVPFPVLNIARVCGGEALNVVPESCAVEIGIRLLPGQQPTDAVRMVEAMAGSIDGNVRVEVEVLNDNPPMLTAEDAPIHRMMCEIVDQHESRGVSFASDAGWLSTLGIDCVLCGPGSIEVAHRSNEFVPIDEFERARRLVDRLIAGACLQPVRGAAR